MSLPTQSPKCLLSSEEGKDSPASPSQREISSENSSEDGRNLSESLAGEYFQR